jgi:hypothetical protein
MLRLWPATSQGVLALRHFARRKLFSNQQGNQCPSFADLSPQTRLVRKAHVPYMQNADHDPAFCEGSYER